MSTLSIVIAAVAGWLAGAVYYMALGKQWVAAQGSTMEAFKARQAALKGTSAAWLPFALAFLAIALAMRLASADPGISTRRALIVVGALGVALWLAKPPYIVFALLFWMFDRGGPAARFLVKDAPLDLLFPQHTIEEGPVPWQPVFFDYVYTSFTAETAFSPTDVMPLTHRAKFTMVVQSTVAIALFGLVVARAVNAFT